MRPRTVLAAGAIGVAALLSSRGDTRGDTTAAAAQTAGDPALARQIFDVMSQLPSAQKGFRVVHAKGVVCQGTFEPTTQAAGLSKAAHFRTSVPVTVRFSDGASDPLVPDGAANAGPRGMAIRFALPAGGGAGDGGDNTDIVAMSHHGFVVATGEEFLALQQAVVATDPAKPHPWPVEQFLGAHPRAKAFVTDNATAPASFATQAFFGNNAFVFVNAAGTRQPGRYQILPAAGRRDLTPEEAKAKPADFLTGDLKARLAKGPVEYRLVVQLPNPGDPTSDPSAVWPADRKTVDVGTLRVTSVVPDSDAAQRALAFDPANLTDGIELSDDPLPELRSRVYALAAKHRRQQQQATPPQQAAGQPPK